MLNTFSAAVASARRDIYISPKRFHGNIINIVLLRPCITHVKLPSEFTVYQTVPYSHQDGTTQFLNAEYC